MKIEIEDRDLPVLRSALHELEIRLRSSFFVTVCDPDRRKAEATIALNSLRRIGDAVDGAQEEG